MVKLLNMTLRRNFSILNELKMVDHGKSKFFKNNFDNFETHFQFSQNFF